MGSNYLAKEPWYIHAHLFWKTLTDALVQSLFELYIFVIRAKITSTATIKRTEYTSVLKIGKQNKSVKIRQSPSFPDVQWIVSVRYKNLDISNDKSEEERSFFLLQFFFLINFTFTANPDKCFLRKKFDKETHKKWLVNRFFPQETIQMNIENSNVSKTAQK